MRKLKTNCEWAVVVEQDGEGLSVRSGADSGESDSGEFHACREKGERALEQ